MPVVSFSLITKRDLSNFGAVLVLTAIFGVFNQVMKSFNFPLSLIIFLNLALIGTFLISIGNSEDKK